MNAMDALIRCRCAWEKVDMQTCMDLWPDSGLDATEGTSPALRCIEPVALPHTPPGDGLTSGAEPCCGSPSELTANRSLHSPARNMSGGSASLFAERMAEQGVTGCCDSGAQSASSASLERALPARGKRVGGASSPDRGQPPDSVTPCADRVPEYESPRAADPWTGQRGTGQEVTV